MWFWKLMPKSLRQWFLKRKLDSLKSWLEREKLPIRHLVGYTLLWSDHYEVNLGEVEVE